jgi:hypothetical protein
MPSPRCWLQTYAPLCTAFGNRAFLALAGTFLLSVTVAHRSIAAREIRAEGAERLGGAGATH